MTDYIVDKIKEAKGANDEEIDNVPLSSPLQTMMGEEKAKGLVAALSSKLNYSDTLTVSDILDQMSIREALE